MLLPDYKTGCAVSIYNHSIIGTTIYNNFWAKVAKFIAILDSLSSLNILSQLSIRMVGN